MQQTELLGIVEPALSERALLVLAFAEEKALKLHHHTIDSSHFLLGFLREEELADTIDKNPARLEIFRRAVEESHLSYDVLPEKLTLGDDARNAIEIAAQMAQEEGSLETTPRHLFKATISEGILKGGRRLETVVIMVGLNPGYLLEKAGVPKEEVSARLHEKILDNPLVDEMIKQKARQQFTAY